ncbi:hypothetical protein ACIRPH_01130 [Nocardiopsis sp. NPDC101807]|uniref:hypothetical protein n=1 Tax=Nocardiopsis sp. NPDC101807 TaxID=3364339 RepID=UPI0037FAD826
MTEEADPGGARAWDARLGWAHGLTADDPAAREAALARLLRAQEGVGRSIARLNEALLRPPPPGPAGRRRDPAFVRAATAHREAERHSLPEALWNRPPGDVRTWAGLPYALLYLEWEAKYPQTWTRYAKKWGTKRLLLRDVAVTGHGEAARARLVGLVAAAVRRRYRCKDREYVRVARAVDGEDLRVALAPAADSEDVWARRHAGYVLWLLDRPGVPNTRRVWEGWNAGEFAG